jgi:putative tryptophan/tyrosine transport system substrate-binding protein
MKQFRIGISDFEIEKAKMKMRVLVTRSQNPQSEIRNPQFLGLICALVFALCSLLLAPCSSAQAQQPKKVPRIGYLLPGNRTSESTVSEAIRWALRELGYLEGQNVAFEYRYAEGNPDRFPELAAELVRLKVDIIVVVGGNTPVRAVKNATKTIPIVMVGGSDPVEPGLVESLARPGGNVTGLQTSIEN